MDARARIEAYDAQGWHRAGSDVDRQSAEWLVEEVRAIGLEPSLEPFTIDRIDPGECYIEVAGKRFDAVPPDDRYANNVDGVVVEEFAAAFSAIARQLAAR